MPKSCRIDSHVRTQQGAHTFGITKANQINLPPSPEGVTEQYGSDAELEAAIIGAEEVFQSIAPLLVLGKSFKQDPTFGATFTQHVTGKKIHIELGGAANASIIGGD